MCDSFNQPAQGVKAEAAEMLQPQRRHQLGRRQDTLEGNSSLADKVTEQHVVGVDLRRNRRHLDWLHELAVAFPILPFDHTLDQHEPGIRAHSVCIHDVAGFLGFDEIQFTGP